MVLSLHIISYSTVVSYPKVSSEALMSGLTNLCSLPTDIPIRLARIRSIASLFASSVAALLPS